MQGDHREKLSKQ